MKRFECFVKHYIFFSFPATLSICMHRFAGRRTIAKAGRYPQGLFSELLQSRPLDSARIAAAFLILSFYSEVVAWVFAYVFKAIDGSTLSSDRC
jgi:SNF family Na+-dependent transporter